MSLKSIPNFNQVELAFLKEFIEGTVELATEQGASTFCSAPILKQVSECNTLVKTGFPDDRCARIIQIEDFRNDLIEIILDRLDDILNIYLEDPEQDLKTVGLSESEALLRIPEYRAALEILGERSTGEPDFHSRLQRAGHVWDEEHIRTLINRFESGEYKQAAEMLGIAGRMNELLAVDHRQVGMIQQCRVGEAIEELRAVRYEIYNAVIPLYQKIYSDEVLFKPKNIVSGVDLVVEILKADQESRESAQFSANTLSHSEFVDLLSPTFSEDQQFIAFKDSLKLFLSAEQGKLFEQNESILYREVERFFTDITIHLLHTEPDRNHPLREKIEKNVHFMNARALVEQLNQRGVSFPINFSRGDQICGVNFPDIANALQDKTLRELLMELRLRPLSEDIVESEAKSRELSAVAVRRNRGLSLLLFRKLRAELTTRFQIQRAPSP